jgi:hypothetical protein
LKLIIISDTSTYKYQYEIALNDRTTVAILEDKDAVCNAFSLSSNNIKATFMANSLEERDRWVKDLKNCAVANV